MKTTLEFFAFGALALILTLIFIPIVKIIAVKVKLVDKPNYRKLHSTPVPLVGGISITFSVMLLLLISGDRLSFLIEYLPIITSGLVLLIVGVIDDKHDVSAKYKLAIQLLLSLIIASSGIRISSLFGLFGIYEIAIWAQYVLTILVITGVVNAFNLMDGVDGLVGGLSLLGFTMFLLASIYFNDYFLGKISVIFMGAIIGFLRFNLSQKKIFMGDAGSLFLGFILVTLGIKLMDEQGSAQNEYAYGFLLLVSFFSIPVLDSLRVYLSRIKRGNSPFMADKSHLHHLLLTAGFTHKKVAVVVVSFSMLFFFIGFGLISYQSTSLIIMVISMVFGLILRLLLMINSLHEWRAKLKGLEQR
ncbi:glycosyltransferase family 4 protein [Flavobacterium nackdongense]|uniref:Undecaprenyl/decaprenyl-phosphate alpha-N-acetylglucosaminyl 1-phosphate transferase n=1 Tax=Flavobacterium nackdongense TaxID=2547394 RepID=A0A4P6YB58_9FLAO|nr:MraY family glycosyltransferase [Flavobacterium nackdongense]QBN17530.1 undecaprenyl/decaprenyl-phosphate alpha-N-acetylglucosaminyl 1-phosphate transferase [Flavobacterium nackdongense]